MKKKQNKTKDNQFPGFYVQSIYNKCYVLLQLKNHHFFRKPVFQVAGRRIYSIQYCQIHNCIIEFTNILYYLTNWNWKG